MAQPIQEPSSDREIEGLGFRSRQLFRRPALNAGAQFDIKMFSDQDVVIDDGTGFVFAIPADLEGSRLMRAEAFVSTAPTDGALEVGVVNVSQATNLLLTPITIDDSELTSYTAAVPSVTDQTVIMATGNLIVLVVNDPSADATGLGVILDFS